jgi:pyrimidine-nucleoside phosphorylase
VKALKNGFVTKMDCKALGMHCVQLGGGRQKTSDVIDFAVGFIMNKKIGDKVKKGEILVTIHCHDSQLSLAKEIGEAMTKKDIVIAATKPRSKKKLIIEVQTKFAPPKKIKSR